MASENSLITTPMPQPTPAPDPGLPDEEGRMFQLEVWFAGRHGSLRWILWPAEEAMLMVVPSTSTPAARIDVDSVAWQGVSPECLERGLSGVTPDHNIAVVRNDGAWRQVLGVC